MNDRLLVGNDIVDLRDRRCPGKSRHLRFVSRIFHPEEASRILSAPDADGTLWLHWAVKESAYKVASKFLGKPPVFEHASFCVHVDHAPEVVVETDSDFNTSGRVAYKEWVFPFRASWSTNRIHALAWCGEDPSLPPPDVEIATGEARVQATTREDGGSTEEVDPYEFLMNERFTARERSSIHSPRSAHVRLMARSAVAGQLEIDESRLEVVCGDAPTGRTPPRIYLDDSRSVVDVSMSHHGRHVAWAFANASTGTLEDD